MRLRRDGDVIDAGSGLFSESKDEDRCRANFDY